MALTKITPQMFDTSAAGHDFNIDNGTFVVDASANRVGIGITTPTTKFHIFDGGTDTGLRIQSAASADNTSSITFDSRLADNTNKQATITAYRGNLNFSGDSGYGKVGIGTSTPSTLLDVNGSVSATSLSVGDILFAGSTISDAADLILDVGGDITLDAGGNQLNFAVGGTTKGRFEGSSDSFVIRSVVSDGDLIFRGNDGGSSVTALTLDMSAAGEATFNSNIISGGKIGIGTGSSTINADSVLHLKSTQPNIYFEDTDDSKSWRLEAGSVFKVQNITTSTEAFRVKQNGAFGIGTAPTDFFDLLGSVSTADIGTDNSAEIVANFVPDSSSNRNGRFRIAGTTTPSNHSVALISDSSTNVGMTFVTTSGGTRGERVVIDSAGNVGIGTLTPSGIFHVRTASGTHRSRFESASSHSLLRVIAGTGSNAGLEFFSGSGNVGNITANSSSTFIFEPGGSSQMTLNTSGQLYLASGRVQATTALMGTVGGYAMFGSNSASEPIMIARDYTTSYPDISINTSGQVSINGTGTSAHQFKVTSSTMAARFQSGNGGYSSVTWTGNNGAQIGSLTTYDGRIYIGAQNPQGTGSNGEIVVKPGTTSSTGGVGTTLGRTPDVSLEVGGPLKIVNNTGAGMISQTHTNMTVGNSGKIIMNFHSIGTMTSGDTIVFTYNAVSWKSWFFKIRFSSTGGYMGELWAGGYNNSSDGYQVLNPRYYAAASGDGASNTTVEGATLSVSRSGQANTMTLTLNNTHVHPLFEIEYSCGGGEGYPRASRASVSVNS